MPMSVSQSDTLPPFDIVTISGGGTLMIYEIRTYTLMPRMQDEVEKRWGEAYPARQKYSPICGFFHTEFGQLNQVISIWPYEDLNERNRIRAEANNDPAWPPNIGEFIVNQQVEI